MSTTFGKPSLGKLEPEFQEPYLRYRNNPDPKNASALLDALKPVIQSGVRTYVGKPNPLSSSRARKLALQAVRSYNPTKARLSTHVHNYLKGLRRITEQQTRAVRIPERALLDRNRMVQGEAELTEELGREPTATELADHLKMPVKRIEMLRRMQSGVSQSMLAFSGPEAQGWSPAVQQPRTDAWLRLVHADQDRTNQKIMEWTFGMYGAPILSNQEIARRLKLSPGAISQRKAKIQQLLDQEDLLSR